METRVVERMVSLDLGDGVFVDVNVQIKLSGTLVPKPPPRPLLELTLDLGDPREGEQLPAQMKLDVGYRFEY